jgi:hypothetical protein
MNKTKKVKEKLETNKKKQISYYLLMDWIKGNDTIQISEEELANINLLSFLEKNFSTYGYLTIFLNEYFNNFSTYSINKLEFLKYLKHCYKLYQSKI